jgi:acyl carrier protein
MRQAGARVTVIQADVSQYEQLAQVFRQVDETLPPLRGVVHAAGVLDDALLLTMQPQQFQNVLAPKVAGTWHLHWLTRQRCLDWFVLFSSAVTLLGLPGQASYAAANAFLDALAHYRRAQSLPALSINWGPWEAVGLAAAQVNRGERLSFRGLPGIAPQQGAALFGHLLQRCTHAQMGVIPLQVRQWRQSFPRVAGLPSLSVLPVEQLSSEAPQTLQLALHNAEPEQQARLVEAHVCEQAAQVVRLAPERIDAHAPFSSLGMDSLMTLELRNRLETTTGLTLPATLVWAYPTIAALGRYLYEQMQSAATPAQPEPVARATNHSDLDDLSEQELAALLDDTLDAMQTLIPDNEQ